MKKALQMIHGLATGLGELTADVEVQGYVVAIMGICKGAILKMDGGLTVKGTLQTTEKDCKDDCPELKKVEKKTTESETCNHEYEDDGENLQIVCKKCGYRKDVEPRLCPGLEISQEIAEKMNLNKLVFTANGISFNLCHIPAGSFMMGSPESEKKRDSDEKQHRVTLTKPYYMLESEVTQELYEAVMGTNPSFFKGAKRPVETVSWNDAVAFCEKLSQLTGKNFRLPTEAEWEYACRAGTIGPYASDLASMAWYLANSGSTTHDVKQKQPNAWGLYDMHGNVWEWCADWADWYGEYSGQDETDPSGPGSGLYRVLRGGSWFSNGVNLRSAYRNGYVPGIRCNGLGFRPVLALRALDKDEENLNKLTSKDIINYGAEVCKPVKSPEELPKGVAEESICWVGDSYYGKLFVFRNGKWNLQYDGSKDKPDLISGDICWVWDNKYDEATAKLAMYSHTQEGRKMFNIWMRNKVCYSYKHWLLIYSPSRQSKKIGVKRWFARDRIGCLFEYFREPYRVGDAWYLDGGENGYIIVPKELLPNLKWEDEPIEVEI